MNWLRVWLGVSDLLSIGLIAKLITLELHSAYRVFSGFLLFQVVSESFVILERFTALDRVIDYRVTWLSIQAGTWLLTIWVVYALLRDILVSLPGILKFSRRFLNVIFPLALLVALVSAGPEYIASGAAAQERPIDYLVSVALILERLVTTIALIVLLATLAFILWFPVTLPRNLALFSIGLSVYFTAKSALILFQHFWSSPQDTAILDNGVALILCICLLYWITFINKRGEHAAVTVGHSWHASRQSKLLRDLEHINAVLARSARR